MNKRQRLVLWLSFGLISISSLFAPWRSYPINKHVAPDITIYRAVFLGPPDQIKEIQRDWIYNGVGPGYFGPGYSVAIGGFRIDTTRLFVEWILILLLAGIAF